MIYLLFLLCLNFVIYTNSLKYNLVNGQPDIYITDFSEKIGCTWFNGNVWDKDLIQRFYRLLKEKETFEKDFVVLDLGAQTGSFSLLAKYFPFSQWHSFEPIEEATNALLENLRINGIENVFVHQKAVSNFSGTTILQMPNMNEWGLSTIGNNPQRFISVMNRKIECISLDSFIFDNDIKKVHFMKLDTEGSELNILRGAKNMILRDHPIILMEYNEINMQQCNIAKEDVDIFLQEMGYLWKFISNEDILCIPNAQSKYKENIIAKMISNQKNTTDNTYQINRAIRAIRADDCDYIPKIEHAGEIINNGDISYQIMHNGVKVIANSYYNAQWLTDVICGLRGHHEPQEEKCFYEVLKYMPENATMIELGSYWAYYSLWFAFQVPGAKNYLIEPDRKRLEVGRKNFELNHKKGFFFQAYLGELFDTDPDIENGAVQQIAVDDFIDNNNISHINILHADIQGGEIGMLRSIKKHLYKIYYFFISTHGSNYHNPCLNFFREHNFTIVAEHTDYESCSGDGLIVAKRAGVYGPDRIFLKKY